MQILLIKYGISYLQNAVNMLYYRQLEMAYLQEVSRWKDLQETGSEKKLWRPQHSQKSIMIAPSECVISPYYLKRQKRFFHIPAALHIATYWLAAMEIKQTYL